MFIRFYILTTILSFYLSTITLFSPVVFAEEELENTVFDIYLDSEYLGLASVQYSETSFFFVDTKEVLELLPVIKNPTQFEKLLEGDIKDQKTLPDLGNIKIDRNTFRVIIKPEADQLKSKNLDLKERLVLSDPSFAFQQGAILASSGQIGEPSQISITPRSVLSYGSNYMVASRSFNTNSSSITNELSLGKIINTNRIEAGLISSPGQTFGITKTYAGVHYGNLESLFANEDDLRGSLLEIFVPARSLVEFYRDGRLLDSQLLDFGLHQINTSQFPQGSYQVEIVFKQDNGQVTRDYRYFTKSGELGLRSVPVYDFGFGVETREDELQDGNFGYGSLKWRVLDFLQLDTSFSKTYLQQLGELQAHAIFGGLQLRTTYGSSFTGDSAISGNIQYSSELITFYVGADKTLQGFENEGKLENCINPIMEGDEEQNINSPTYRRCVPDFGTLIGGAREAFTGSIGRRFDKVDLRFSYNESVTGDRPKRSAIGPRVLWSIYDKDGFRVQANGSLLKTENGRKGEVSLAFSYLFGGYNLSTSSIFRDNISGRQLALRPSLSYNSRNRGNLGTVGDIFTEVRPLNTVDNSIAEIGVNGSHNSSLLEVSGNVRTKALKDNDFNTTYGGTIRTSLTATEEGGLSVTSPVGNDAFVLIVLDSEEKDLEVELLLDGTTTTKLKSGSQTIVKLTPYHSHKISVRPAETSKLIRYDSDAFEVTPIPTNIFHHRFKVDSVKLLYGRILNSRGEPIPWRKIRGIPGIILTEEEGFFQGEFGKDDKPKIELDEGTCHIKLPHKAFQQDSDIFDAGDLVCK